jgi:hypothetical protein
MLFFLFSLRAHCCECSRVATTPPLRLFLARMAPLSVARGQNPKDGKAQRGPAQAATGAAPAAGSAAAAGSATEPLPDAPAAASTPPVAIMHAAPAAAEEAAQMAQARPPGGGDDHAGDPPPPAADANRCCKCRDEVTLSTSCATGGGKRTRICKACHSIRAPWPVYLSSAWPGNPLAATAPRDPLSAIRCLIKTFTHFHRPRGGQDSSAGARPPPPPSDCQGQ